MIKGIRGYLFKILNDNIMTDVTFVVQGTDIKAHRAVVGAREGPLRDLLKSKVAEEKIEIDDVAPKTFRTVLQFLYTDDCDVNPQNLFELMHVARKFSLEDLEGHCMKANVLKVSAANVGLLMVQAQYFEAKECLKTCREYFKANICEVMNANEFLEVPHEALVEFCSTESIPCSALDLFALCIKWAKHACKCQNLSGLSKNLRTVLGDVVSKIRFSEMPMQHFLEFVVPVKVLTHEEVGQVIEQIQDCKTFVDVEDWSQVYKLTVKGYIFWAWNFVQRLEEDSVLWVPLSTKISQLKKMKIFNRGTTQYPSDKFTLEHKGKELTDDVTLASIHTPGEDLTLKVHAVTYVIQPKTILLTIKTKDLKEKRERIVKGHLYSFENVETHSLKVDFSNVCPGATVTVSRSAV